MEANVENIFNVQITGMDIWSERTELRIWSTQSTAEVELSENQRRGLTIFTLNKNDMFKIKFNFSYFSVII